MEITFEGIMLFISWVILFIGIILLIFIPALITHFINWKKFPRNTALDIALIEKSKDKKMLLDYIVTGMNRLKDRRMLLDYYIVAGITITIIGFLLVLIFSNKLILPKF